MITLPFVSGGLLLHDLCMKCNSSHSSNNAASISEAQQRQVYEHPQCLISCLYSQTASLWIRGSSLSSDLSKAGSKESEVHETGSFLSGRDFPETRAARHPAPKAGSDDSQPRGSLGSHSQSPGPHAQHELGQPWAVRSRLGEQLWVLKVLWGLKGPPSSRAGW